MQQQQHIINKQIIEIQLSKTADAFEVQQKLGELYREQLTPIIDKVLCDRYGSIENERLQIDRLTIDLGSVQLEDITSVFEEKFKETLAEIQDSGDVTDLAAKGKTAKTQKTPLRVLSHYLKTGILPWWAENTTKAFLLDQLDQLIKTPNATFTKMLSQLRFNTVYLERFLYTFTEKQLLASIQVLTDFSVQGLSMVKKELLDVVKKNSGQKFSAFTASQLRGKPAKHPAETQFFDFETSLGELNATMWIKIKKTFWKAAFNQIPIAKDYETLKKECIRQTLLELRIDQKKESKEYQNIYLIRSLVEKYSTQYPGDTLWQQFFQQVSQVVNSPFFYKVAPDLLEEFRQLLLSLELSQKKSLQTNDTEIILQSIAQCLQLLQKSTRKQQPTPETMVIEQLSSNFEDTDFITIQNAGLIIFWPFLQQFFENLGLMEDKTFSDQTARDKAICALQYLCGEEDTALFEAAFPLNKILCGASLEDVVPLIFLSAEEKKIAEDLLQAVIARGPHWTNLSIEGFRASYVRRPGSLRTRDGHWLLQVQKETYDITLEKLPWSINTVKLPWMNEILIVAWN